MNNIPLVSTQPKIICNVNSKIRPPRGSGDNLRFVETIPFWREQKFGETTLLPLAFGRNLLQKYVNNKIHVPLHRDLTLIDTTSLDKFGAEKSENLFLLQCRDTQCLPPLKDGEVKTG